jgi:hypothetical protein
MCLHYGLLLFAIPKSQTATCINMFGFRGRPSINGQGQDYGTVDFAGSVNVLYVVRGWMDGWAGVSE